MVIEQMKNKNLPTESVWDYPRPPRLESVSQHIRIVHQDIILADSNRTFRVLETSHPPVYYIPAKDIRMEYLQLVNGKQSFCEFKGSAIYYHLRVGTQLVQNVAWAYPTPSHKFSSIANHLAFYASKVGACYVGDEQVQAQEGDFYGGWITSNIKGPFKGGPGTWGW